MNIQNNPTTTTDTTKPPLDLDEIEVGRWESHTATRGMSVALSDIIDEIRNPSEEVKHLVAEIAATYLAAGMGKAGKDAIRSLKARLACVAFSATGTRREPEAATGLLCLDLDELGDKLTRARRDFRSEPHVVAVFVSPSGDGLKVIFRVPVTVGSDSVMRKAHRRIFKAAQKYVKKQFGLDVDPAASDLLRLCYLTYDPDVLLNEQASELDVERYHPSEDEDPDNHSDDPAAKDGADPVVRIVDEDVVWGQLSSIPPRPPYKKWMCVSAAVRNAVGDTERAIALLKKWSPEEYPGEYRNLLDSSSFSRIGHGTLLYHARLDGFEGVIRKCYYYNKGERYYLRQGKKLIGPMSEGPLKAHLRTFGVDPSSNDCPTCKIRLHQSVDFVGEVAGHAAGLHEFNGCKFLVPTGPTIIEAGPGNGQFVFDILISLLAGHGEIQYDNFLAWLKRAREAVKRGRRTKLPVLVVAGAGGNGKTLLIKIVSLCLGGRMAKAYRFLTGETHFNKSVIGSELLHVDDDAASRDPKSRAILGQTIKSNQFANTVSVEPKGVDAIDLAPVHAVIIAVNDSPQHLRVLPELDESMRDKIILLRTSRALIPKELVGEEDLILERIMAALPGFLRELEALNTEDQYNDLTGRLNCHWNESLVEQLRSLAPEEELLELAYSQLNFVSGLTDGALAWEGTAADLTSALTAAEARTRFAASRLFVWPGAAGTYLSRLSDDGTGRVAKLNQTRSGRIQRYRIVRHTTEQSEECEETFSNSDNILNFPTRTIGRSGQPPSSPSSLSALPHGAVPILEPGDVEIDTTSARANPSDAA